MKIVPKLLTGLFVLLSTATVSFSQCKFIIDSEMAEEQPARKPEDQSPRNSVFTLSKDRSFKISLDSVLTSDYDRTGDYAVFSVVDEVYVEESRTINSQEKRIRCLFIPKNTKVYGRVEHVNPKTPFNIGGKARVYVHVDSLRLGETNIPIKFVIKPIPVMSKTRTLVPCKHDSQKECVAGRRSRGKIPNDFAKPAADIWVNNENENFNGTELVATATGGILASAGLGALINRPDAVIKAGHVFDVEVTMPVSLWFKMPGVDK